MGQMRAGKNEAKGTSGQSFVKGQFEELGWGAISNPEHDLGTDLFLMARDERRFETGALVGAQVKNWAVVLHEPAVHKGEEGWWLSQDEDHWQYWLTHRLPHLVVFYNMRDKVSYWVHVVADAVVSTGTQRKIFVPKRQTVDSEHFSELLETALASPPVDRWEGSAWTPGQAIPRDSQLRYALLTPRLISPHPNVAAEDVSAPEAIALLASVRISDVQELTKTQPLLASNVSAVSSDPEWRLFSAVQTFVRDGILDPLRELGPSGEAPHVEAARVAATAAALFEDGDVSGAVELLNDALGAHDEYSPVDFAWLNLHMARNLIQTGNLERARDLAIQVSQIGQVAPSDPTARFLSGIAANMLFTLSGWQAQDIERTIRARDTVASWWRSQTMTTGLAQHLENAFDDWAGDTSVTFGATDTTWTRTRSAMLVSGFGADTDNWRYESSLLAQHMLLREPNDGQVSNALHLLRRAGEHKKLKLAARRVLNRGPVDVLREVASEIDLERSTRVSLRCDLELLSIAAPILAPATADETIAWLLQELKDPHRRSSALALTFLYAEGLILCLARLYSPASSKKQADVRDYVAGLPPVEDQSVAHNYAVLLNSIDDQHWSEHQLQALQSRDGGDNVELTNALEKVTAARDAGRRAALLERIENGDAQALNAWGNVRDLPGRASAAMTAHTAASVRAETAQARSGMHSIGTENLLRRLVLLNIWHPESAEWDACIESLSEERSSSRDLLPGIKLMTLLADCIPSDVKEKLRTPLTRLESKAPAEPSFFGTEDIRGDAVLLLQALFPYEVSRQQINELMRGTTEQAAAAARIIGSLGNESDLSALVALSASADDDIRTSVAVALAEWASVAIGGEETIRVLEGMLADPGVQLGIHVTRSLDKDVSTPGAQKLADLLEAHPSVHVRNRIGELRQAWSTRA